MNPEKKVNESMKSCFQVFLLIANYILVLGGCIYLSGFLHPPSSGVPGAMVGILLATYLSEKISGLFE